MISCFTRSTPPHIPTWRGVRSHVSSRHFPPLVYLLPMSNWWYKRLRDFTGVYEWTLKILCRLTIFVVENETPIIKFLLNFSRYSKVDSERGLLFFISQRDLEGIHSFFGMWFPFSLVFGDQTNDVPSLSFPNLDFSSNFHSPCLNKWVV